MANENVIKSLSGCDACTFVQATEDITGLSIFIINDIVFFLNVSIFLFLIVYVSCWELQNK